MILRFLLCPWLRQKIPENAKKITTSVPFLFQAAHALARKSFPLCYHQKHEDFRFNCTFIFIFYLAPIATDARASEDRYKWTTFDAVLQSSFVALVFVDWQQTREFTGDRCKYPDKYETNPLLRDHPSAREVNLVVAGSIIVHSAVAYLLPKPYRTLWQALWIGVEGQAVHSNFEAGIGMRF